MDGNSVEVIVDPLLSLSDAQYWKNEQSDRFVEGAFYVLFLLVFL